MSELPVNAFPRCDECGGPVHPSPRTLYEIKGYERDRSQGGTNHVIARRRTGRMIGPCCAERVQAGVDAGQGTLVDA
jgi:hypothetical protein